MAVTVVEFGTSTEKVEFSGSSEDDMRHAKMFWQSMQLNPPMESRLVSNDITQRLRVATPGHQGVSTHPVIQTDSSKLKAFLANANVGDDDEMNENRRRKSEFRQVDMELLQKHRRLRIEQEKISNPHRMHGVRVSAEAADKVKQNNLATLEQENLAQETRQQIQEFEQLHASPTN